MNTNEQITTLEQYSQSARRTRKDETCGDMAIIYPTLGLTGEAGEVSDKVKKVIRDNGGHLTPERTMAILLELGDVLWYISALADDLGSNLTEVATLNIGKLASRQERNTLNGEGDNR